MVDALLAIVNKYKKYPLEAYVLIFQTLEWCSAKVSGVQHLTGQQLAQAMFAYSVAQYGFLASTVWRQLNLLRSEDIGAMVYHLVEEKLIGKQDSDRIEDFNNVLSVEEFDTVTMGVVGEKGDLKIEYTIHG